MQLPLQITFRGMPPSEAIAADIRDRVAKLDELFDRITSCRVVVEVPHRHHHQGKLYQVVVDVTVPGKELVVKRGAEENHAHEDVYVAIRDAVDAAARQLEDYVRARRGDTKHHEESPRGHVAKLMPDDGYGFLETADGREIFFHQHSLVNGDFERLQVGDLVRFTEEAGAKGPQASTVHLAGRGATHRKRTTTET